METELLRHPVRINVEEAQAQTDGLRGNVTEVSEQNEELREQVRSLGEQSGKNMLYLSGAPFLDSEPINLKWTSCLADYVHLPGGRRRSVGKLTASTMTSVIYIL